MKLSFILAKIISISFAILGGLSLFNKFDYLSDIAKLLLAVTIALIVSIFYLAKTFSELKNLKNIEAELQNTNRKLQDTNKKLNNIISIKN